MTIYYIDNKNNGNIIIIIQQADCQETLEAVKKEKKSLLKSNETHIQGSTERKRKRLYTLFCKHPSEHSIVFVLYCHNKIINKSDGT